MSLTADHGLVPGTVSGQLNGGPVNISLEYRGKATTDARGIVTSANAKVVFGYEHFQVPIRWNVKFYRWNESENPTDVHANPKNFSHVLSTPPIKELVADHLDLAGAALAPGLPVDHYATLAEGNFEIPKGRYTVDLTTDDGARVWLDGKLIIDDAWKYQGPTLYSRMVKLGGHHRIRVEHFQIDGYAALKLSIRRK